MLWIEQFPAAPKPATLGRREFAGEITGITDERQQETEVASVFVGVVGSIDRACLEEDGAEQVRTRKLGDPDASDVDEMTLRAAKGLTATGDGDGSRARHRLE